MEEPMRPQDLFEIQRSILETERKILAELQHQSGLLGQLVTLLTPPPATKLALTFGPPKPQQKKT